MKKTIQKGFKLYFIAFFLFYIIILITKILFVVYNDYKQIYPIFWGYKFDFAVCGIFAFITNIFFINKKVWRIVLLTSAITIIILQISDIMYFKEANRHITYEVEDIGIDFIPLLKTAINTHTKMFIIGSILIVAIGIAIIKLPYKLHKGKDNALGYIIYAIFSIGISIFFIRGGFQHIPLHPYQAAEIGSIEGASIALNGTYSIIYSLAHLKKKLTMKKIPIPTKKDIVETFKDLYPEKINTERLPYLKDKPNIVLFFLESWSGKFLHKYGYPIDITPNFSWLYDKGIKIKYMIANGHRTTEGLFATLTSFDNPLGNTIAKTNLQTFHYDSLINLFNKEGYYSAFFQGTNKDTSGTASLSYFLGFKENYGKRDIKERIYPENSWGIQDIDLYNFVLKKLKDIKKPFIIGINGATTHSLELPPNIPMQRYVKDDYINKILNVLHISDIALGKFINKLKRMYPNTIFVIFADHCGGGLKGSLENYIIPFVIFSPLLSNKYYHIVGSQKDIAPTIIDLALGNYKTLAPNFAGKSIISDKKFFANYYHNNIIGWIEEDNLVEYNISTNKYKCYKLIKYHKEENKCENIHKILVKYLISYTYITQKLLFSGKTKEFHKWRYHLSNQD